MSHEEPEDKLPDNEQIDWKYTDLPVSQESDPKICFIASVVYGSPHSPEVEALRQFRDNVLERSELGRKIVRLYYGGWGEGVAEIVKERLPFAIPVIKRGLDYLVKRYEEHQNYKNRM